MITIDELIAYSGDSTLLDYSYKNNVLSVRLEFSEVDKIVIIDIPTNEMSIQTPKKFDIVFLNCFIELNPLTDLLGTENGVYIPANDFGKMMKETRLNLNLAYGLKVSEYRYIILSRS